MVKIIIGEIHGEYNGKSSYSGEDSVKMGN